MYTPPAFSEDDPVRQRRLIERYSFATLVSHDGRTSLASHLPLLLDGERGPQGTLQGHLARANPQWTHADGQEILAIFHGPHTYISPTWYRSSPAVPTWNYVVVHAYGTLRVEPDRGRALEILRRFVDTYEASQPRPWSLEQASEEYIDRLLDAIVAFEIPIQRLEAKCKLSQNQDPSRREGVIDALRQAADPVAQQIADLMASGLADAGPGAGGS